MNSKKATVLVVDDSNNNIQIMTELLKAQYEILSATNAKEALKMLDEGFCIDLILLDVIMPEMNGYELCELILKNQKYKHIPIIFVTILEHEKDIVKGLELGAVDYVVKPIEPVVLKARIKTHIKLKQYKDRLLEDIKTKEELILSQSKLAIVGEMFENITHQWKQPLSSISVATSGMKIQKKYEQLDDELLSQGLLKIEESVKYLSHTVDDFRDFLENDRQRHCFNIKALVDKTLSLFDSKFKDSHIKVKNNVDESIDITNYENDLMQILMNLFSNAQDVLIQRNKDKKQITIFSQIKQNQIIICVQDNAGGIDKENIELIFNKYFSTKNYKDASGVGLFMSKKIAQERLNANIQAHNVNDGACFDILLPRVI